jgi:hypothetical protein
MALRQPFPRDFRRSASFAAAGVALWAVAALPLGAAEAETAIRSVEIPGFGAVRFPAPSAWRIGAARETESAGGGTDGGTQRSAWFQVTPDGGTGSEMNVSFSWSVMPDPAFNGPSVLRALVERMARAALEESIEAHYTLRELRSPRGGGYAFTLRARQPRKKSQSYLTSGAFGLGNALLRFTFLAPEPDLPEAAEALNLIAGVRIDDEPAPVP